MITIATVAPELVPATPPMRPDGPLRESIEPPVSPSAQARRAEGRGARADDDRGSFATALADQMESGAAEPGAAGVERPPASRTARVADTTEDGDEPPPDGNGLPSWLVGLPLSASGAALPSAAAGPVAAASYTNELMEAPVTPTTVSGSAPLPAASSAPAVAAPDEAIEVASALAQTAGEPVTAAAHAVPLPDAELLAAQSRAEAAAPAAVASSARARTDVPPPLTPPGDALPASASDVARLVAQAVGRQGAPAPSPAAAHVPPAAPDRRIALGGLATSGAPVATPATPVVAGSVAPALRNAATAALAADGEPSADLAPAVPQSPSFAAALAATTGPSTAPAANAPALQIPVAVGAQDWDRQLGERVGVLVDQGLTNAQLKLSPAHLGPLEIRISVQNDQANVWFGTHSHATREALEAAAPKLREMLGAQGFAGVGVSVDLQQQAQRQSTPSSRHEPEYSFAAGGSTAAAAAPERATGAAAARAADRSRLDAFA
jgi:flagellar hook-length control protein FliK